VKGRNEFLKLFDALNVPNSKLFPETSYAKKKKKKLTFIALSKQFIGWYLNTNHARFLRKFKTVLPVLLKTV